MAVFESVQATPEGSDIRVRFRLNRACLLGWQIFDPATGAFLFEGEWSEARAGAVDLRVALPAGDGPYRVQVAPVEDRDRFVLIDAHMTEGELSLEPARVTSGGALRRAGLLRAIPKAFSYPVRSLWANHKLIATMVRRDILSRYRGSFGGALWTFLNPLLLIATYFFVFGVVLNDPRASRTEFVLYFLAGMLPWLAFSEAVGRSATVIVDSRTFVKKLVFPLDTLPLNLVFSGAVTEAFGLLVFLAGLLIAQHTLPLTVLWLPVLVIPQLLFTAALCWFLSALGVFLRDLSQIVGFLLQLWFFLTPIVYRENPTVLKYFGWNPFLLIVRGYRAIFIYHHAPDPSLLAIMWIGSAALAVLGYAWFHRLRRSFADII
ncbi:MAG TPA: ABC transporter permease [Bryobacteraceae bacterium]|jgi:lipopolysaccharide transport system permease protein